jgi:tetratricopeptide (TPR) repeat protein
MKKAILAIMIVFAMLAVAQQTPPQQPAAQPGAQAAAPAQTKTIKDPAEYNAYVNALNQQDPNQKAAALEGFLQQYTNSVMKVDALELLMATYEQTGNRAKVTDTANRLLQVDPNNLRALALLAFTGRTAAQSATNQAQGQQELTQAAQYAQRGLQALQTATKPEGVSQPDWDKLKTQTAVIFNGVLGLNGMNQKDYATAQKYLRAAVDANPKNINDVYPLALSYLQSQPPQDAQGIFFMARAGVLAAGSPAQAQITDFGRKRYIKYHGGEDGWDQVLAAAQANELPPADFTIKPAPTPAEQAAKLVESKPINQMSFDEFQLIFTSGNQQASQQVWSQIENKPIAFVAKVMEATPTKLTLAATAEDIEANKPDVVVTMAAPLPKKLVPAVGSMAQVEATPVNLSPNPFTITMEKGVLAVKEEPKAAPKKAPAKKKSP